LYVQISRLQINRHKFNNNFKREDVNDMFTRPYKIIHFELKNNDIEILISQDVKIIKRNEHYRTSILSNSLATFFEIYDINKKCIEKQELGSRLVF